MVAVEQGEGEIPTGTQVLRRYSVVGKLAQGGMAEVYLARQLGPAGYNKLIVVKRVRPHLANDTDFVGMFVNEARLAAMINHPNVVQIFDLGDQPRPAHLGGGTDWFLAMEYLDGRDMLQVGRACRALNKAVPFDVTARIIADACAGLDHAHGLKGADGKSLDLVHRDMSPENILVTFEGQVKVVDFGIAKASDNLIKTQAGQIKGKLGYVAPEAILGKPLDARADVFAIGATLYLFLAGRPAFSGTNPMEIFERSLKPPTSPREVNNRVPEALDVICMKALAQDRDKRYRSAGEVRVALEAYLQSTGRPLGSVQLGQFMKILFPPDKDPVRQRIDKLLADAPAAAGSSAPGLSTAAAGAQLVAPRSPTLQPAAVSGLADATRPAAAPAPVLVDDDKTNIVPARADDIPPPPQKPKAIPSPAASVPPHLRSLGLTGSAAARNPDLTHEDIDVIEARRSAGALSEEQAAAPVPRQASVLPAAPASLAPASVLAPPAHVAEVTVTADRPPPLDDDIDLDAPTVEVQSVVRRGAVTSQIDIAASLMAGQEHSVDDLPPPPLEASGATRRPPPPAFAPSPPAAAPLAAPLALLPPTNAEPPPLAFSMEGRPAGSMSSPPSLPPPRQPVGQPPSAPPPLAAPASAAPPAPPADDYEAAASLVWTAENPNAPLPPVAPLRPRTQDDVDGAMPSLTPAGARPQTAAPLPLPAPLPPQWTTPEAPAGGPGPGLKAAMFLFGALSGVVLLFVFLWVTGLSARVF